MATGKNRAQLKTEPLSHTQLKEAQALSSLCDVEDKRSRKSDSQVLEANEEFDFHLWGSSFSSETEMCAADEVFFQGQILPLQINNHKFNCNKSMSLDFLDHGSSLGESRSNSSRSSSFKTQNSPNYSTSSITILTPRISLSDQPKVKNRFHTYPSPKPQLKVPLPRQSSFSNVARKSSTWDFFRLGVVPTPEIELQNLKVRGTKNCVSRNGSTRNSKSGRIMSTNHGLRQFLDKGGGFFSGCKCSIDMPLDNVIINSCTIKSTKETESVTRAMKEKVVIEFEKERQRQKHQEKNKDVSSQRRRFRRTFEWLKELSHASYLDEEEALLLN